MPFIGCYGATHGHEVALIQCVAGRQSWRANLQTVIQIGKIPDQPNVAVTGVMINNRPLMHVLLSLLLSYSQAVVAWHWPEHAVEQQAHSAEHGHCEKDLLHGSLYNPLYNPPHNLTQHNHHTTDAEQLKHQLLHINHRHDSEHIHQIDSDAEPDEASQENAHDGHSHSSAQQCELGCFGFNASLVLHVSFALEGDDSQSFDRRFQNNPTLEPLFRTLARGPPAHS